VRSTVRRSLLFVPGAERKKIDKARESGADTVIFDLEDSVAPDAKQSARETVAEALRTGAQASAEPAVRVNAPGTEHFENDLEAAIGAGARAVLVPKTETPDGIAAVSERIAALESRFRLEARSVKILALVETAKGITLAHTLATPRLAALCFGHADFALDMGLPEADASTGAVYHARCTLVIAAKAIGVAPIDCVFLSVKDEQAFRRDAEMGLGLGYDGKLCIHPAQVGQVNQVYTPTATQIDYAKRVVEGWRQAQAAGCGVFALEGKMIDVPLVRAQERVLERAGRASGEQKSG